MYYVYSHSIWQVKTFDKQTNQALPLIAEVLLLTGRMIGLDACADTNEGSGKENARTDEEDEQQFKKGGKIKSSIDIYQICYSMAKFS